jgi:hypothetical protein
VQMKVELRRTELSKEVSKAIMELVDWWDWDELTWTVWIITWNLLNESMLELQILSSGSIRMFVSTRACARNSDYGIFMVQECNLCDESMLKVHIVAILVV